jgi:hypothetical protein
MMNTAGWVSLNRYASEMNSARLEAMPFAARSHITAMLSPDALTHKKT